MEHNQSSYFCQGPDEFCWGPAPVCPTLVTGRFLATKSNVASTKSNVASTLLLVWTGLNGTVMLMSQICHWLSVCTERAAMAHG